MRLNEWAGTTRLHRIAALCTRTHTLTHTTHTDRHKYEQTNTTQHDGGCGRCFHFLPLPCTFVCLAGWTGQLSRGPHYHTHLACAQTRGSVDQVSEHCTDYPFTGLYSKKPVNEWFLSVRGWGGPVHAVAALMCALHPSIHPYIHRLCLHMCLKKGYSRWSVGGSQSLRLVWCRVCLAKSFIH
uniref:Uncharacterized protein n=1 Tax=Vitrella brassicaformis TaxID=1169539 RepID=A0A7S1P8D0_9ALVE|mmetsp:Transcript_44964/g.111683  ORF Transcript_44964/g.111683 Transcript_44964/m.111683 type:complete len:183 (+) Transcript_44964:53-601(+)